MLNTSKIFFALLLSALVLTACEEHKPNTHLKLTMVNDETRAPVNNVTAILYNQDNVSFDAENVRVSGDDGVVDFGDVGRDTITITIYHKSNSRWNEYEITSFVEVAPWVGEYELYISDDSQTYCYNGSADPASGQLAKIQIDLSGLPVEADSVQMQTPGSFYPDLSGTKIYDYFVCPDDVQDDGKLSLVVEVLDYSNDIIGYAFLLDQEIIDGNTYTLEYSNRFKGISATITPDGDIVYAGIALYRDPGYVWGDSGAPAAANSYWHSNLIDFETNPGSVNFQIPDALQADNRLFYIYSMIDGNEKARWLSTVTQQNVDLQFSDLRVTHFNNSARERVIRWAASGNTRASYFGLDYEIHYQGSPYSDNWDYHWSINLPPSATSWSIMDLPINDQLTHDIATELTRQQSDAELDHSITANVLPKLRYRKSLNRDYVYDLIFDENGNINWNTESTTKGFRVNSEGITAN
ncbi:MAG: hypothetical protein OEY67_08660 [Gammaproteobacteria bacterium]|nr:hypothetical protein [Gammaproteobacteria bacterium]